MTSLKPLPWRVPAPRPPWTHPARRAAAATLRTASAVLARMARRVAVPAQRVSDPLPRTLEFYASAGAPEGALYVNGELVGWIPGVKRL
ncbi:hypothetical protein [Piscinibacter sp.]|uniref:hypothetical protein n=1 Tax=Piscinibacter sp. TaxID=1903157 RepID=UPI002C51ECBD|nr:hypothetical protein [Albitalea sp.]HUG25314.1 hypothetical protein [Albitalea sp.]